MLIKATVWNIARVDKGTTILLKPAGKTTAIPIFISNTDAHSLLAGLHGIRLPRPLAHDLLATLLNKTGTRLEKVVIHDIKEGNYHAVLHLTGTEGSFTMDARPSDALSLAVRLKTPLYIEEKIVTRSSVRIEMGGTSELMVEQLEEELKQAVDKEDYEHAAEIRDKLKALKQ